MAEKKLTKVQKEILTTLRDAPGAMIISLWRAGYELGASGKERSIRWESFLFLKPWLIQKPKERGADIYYTFKPGAEISDAWRTQEIERQRQEAQRKRDEENRRKEEEAAQLFGRLRAAITALSTGQIPVIEFHSHAAVFEYEGKTYVTREE